MFDNLTLRNTFLAVAAMPACVLILVAFWATAIDRPVLAVWAGLGAVVTMAVGHIAGQRVAERLTVLDETLSRLTGKELPAVVASINDPDTDTGAVAGAEEAGEEAGTNQGSELPAIPEDELTVLTRTIGGIGTLTGNLLAAQETVTNRRLAELVKNLARRNQSLLSHQIEHIDWLEDTEQNPPRLEQLFKLDHLATRLRRSAETVLVLAGGESTQPRGGPAPIATVLRVAMGETEAYTKIKLRTIEDVLIAGGPAFDLVHLLAELLENATQFSPPETPVELHAIRLEDRSYQVTIIDRGVGMDDDKLEIANELVTNPPEINLAIGRSIGFIVIGRLAERLEATVEIAHTPGSGVTATVVVPARVVFDAPPRSIPPPAPPAPRPEQSGTGSPPSGRPAAATTWTAPEPQPKSKAPGDRPATEPAASGDPVRPRVTEDSSNALAKLLGISDNIAELEDSDGWQAPAVEGGTSNPLKSRSAPKPIPPSLGGDPGTGTDDQVEPEPEEGPEAKAEEPPAQPKRTSRAKRSKSGRPKRRPRQAQSLDEALPSGVAFDSGIEGLLIKPSESSATDSGSSIEDLRPAEDDTTDDEDPTGAGPTGDTPSESDAPSESDGETRGETSGDDDAWVPPTVSGAPEAKLTRREKGASNLPSSDGPRVKASSRKPEEIRSMITRYRDGLKGSVDGTTDDAADDSAGPDEEGPAEDPPSVASETPSPEPGKEG